MNRDPIFIPLSDHEGSEYCEVCFRRDCDLVDDDMKAVGGETSTLCLEHLDDEAKILVMRHFN